MEEFDESQLPYVSDEVDMFIQEVCIKYKMPPLAFSAIALARLIHLNNTVESSDDFAKLLMSVGQSILNKELEKPEILH